MNIGEPIDEALDVKSPIAQRAYKNLRSRSVIQLLLFKKDNLKKNLIK